LSIQRHYLVSRHESLLSLAKQAESEALGRYDIGGLYLCFGYFNIMDADARLVNSKKVNIWLPRRILAINAWTSDSRIRTSRVFHCELATVISSYTILLFF
jgi:hypothetical protein